MQVYNNRDQLARQTLAAVCRSCHVRLRSDTFSAILDDCPLQPGSVSSSMLQCLQYANNFGLRKQFGDKWTLKMSQEGVLNKSLVTVISVNDTRQGTSPNVCKLQVRHHIDCISLVIWLYIMCCPVSVCDLLLYVKLLLHPDQQVYLLLPDILLSDAPTYLLHSGSKACSICCTTSKTALLMQYNLHGHALVSVL